MSTGQSARSNADVVVVGAGTAGLQAALQLAKVGRSVVVLERRGPGQGGARWCNGVVAWQFDRAGLAPPEPPERRGGGRAAHMLSPSGRHRFTIDASPIVEADMRLLGERLQADAEAAGVTFRWHVTDVTLDLAAGRPRTVHGSDPDGAFAIDAALVVDASGRAGVIRQQVPDLAAWCPPSGSADLCSAQHHILAIDDLDGAKRFLYDHQAEPGDAVVALGIDGGYSTINIQVDETFGDVSVLTGTIPGPTTTTGARMLQAVRELHPWIGESHFGGGALIPLRRTYDRFTAPGVALVGDAASQVMAAHGSGIGFGLIAGKVLAEAVASADDPGDPDALWRYQARYLREFGAILAAYDAVRRMSVALGPDGVEDLFATGIFSPALVLPGLEQQLGMLSPAEIAEATRTLARRRDLARIVVPALAAMGVARPLYRAYPAERSERGFRAWAATAVKVLPRQP